MGSRHSIVQNVPAGAARYRASAIEARLHSLFIVDGAACLRDEDRQKAAELAALLVEVDRAVRLSSRARPLVLVDAAAGKAGAGLLAAELVLAPAGRAGRVVVIERDPARIAACQAAAQRLDAPGVAIECVAGAVGDASLWPAEPDLVVALHACGPAADAVIDRAASARARRLLVIPCCTGAAVPAEPLALAAAESMGMPRHAEVRRRFIQAFVDAERTLRLEAAGYATEVVAFVSPRITPHNLLWRARRVGEPGQMRDAAARLARLRTTFAV